MQSLKLPEQEAKIKSNTQQNMYALITIALTTVKCCTRREIIWKMVEAIFCGHHDCLIIFRFQKDSYQGEKSKKSFIAFQNYR